MGSLRLLTVFLLFGCSYGLLAQDSADSAVYRTALENAASKSFKAQRGIYIGRAYTEKAYQYKNSTPFFLTDKKMAGEIHYNDIQYRNQLLQYDLLLDEVVVEHVSGRRMILVKDKVTAFTIGGYFFKKMAKPEIDDKMTPGFYNILTEGGGMQLLAKRQAQEKRSKVGYNKEEVIVEDQTKYFLKKDSTFFEVKNYKAIAKILRDKTQKSSFRAARKLTSEEKMVSVVKYYVNLKQ